MYEWQVMKRFLFSISTSASSSRSRLLPAPVSWYSFARVKASVSTSSTPILVSGKRGLAAVEVRFTFSPKANFINGSQLANFNCSALLPHLNFSNCVCPPMVLQLPCSIWLLVTPPLNCRYMSTSSGSITSAILVSAVTLCEHSLIPPEAAICECSSIMPAVKCLPVPSITFADASFKSFPTATIFPFFTSTSVAVSLPSFSFVQTVAFFIKIFSCLGISLKP